MGNMKQLYDTKRKLSGRYYQMERPVKDKEGNTIRGTKEQLDRWAEHFQELMNRPSPPHLPGIPEVEADLPSICTKPTSEGIKNAIKQLKNGKAPGSDDIPAEALKGDVDTSAEILYPLFDKIWEEEEVPLSWKEGYIVTLPKKVTSANVPTIEESCFFQ